MKTLKVVLKSLEGAPAEFQLLPYGAVEIEGEQPAFVDEAAMAAMIDQFERRGNDMVIDYEHQTLKDVQAPAAGWIRRLVDKGRDGLWAAVEWTEAAGQYLKNREYRYFSPVFWVTESSRKVAAIENVALTNSPKINNLAPLVAKTTIYQKEHKTMLIQKLIQLFALAESAGEDKVIEAAEAVVAKNTELAADLAAAKAAQPAEVVACKEVLDVLKLDDQADKRAVIAAISGLDATGDAAKQLSLEVAKLRSKIAGMEQADLVSMALKEGKTSPEELDKWGRDLALKSPEQFRQIVLSRPAGSVIALDKIGHPPAQRRQQPADEAVLAVAKMMGNTAEDLEKYAA